MSTGACEEVELVGGAFCGDRFDLDIAGMILWVSGHNGMSCRCTSDRHDDAVRYYFERRDTKTGRLIYTIWDGGVR